MVYEYVIIIIIIILYELKAPPGMSSKFMEMYGNDDYISNNEMPSAIEETGDRFSNLYVKTDQYKQQQLLENPTNGNSNGNNNISPSSSKNSSSDSLNYILRKDTLADAAGHSASQMVSNNSNSDFSNLNLTKKKSLKTTLYRIFTQRKKSKSFSILSKFTITFIYLFFFLVQKFRNLQKTNSQMSSYTPGDYDQNSLTIKTESDKKIKKK